MAEACICAVCQKAAEKVAENLSDKTLSLISNPITLVRKCNNNVDNLKQRADELKLRKGTADDYVDVVHRRGEEIGPELKNWLTSANNLTEAADKLAADAEENAKKKCFFGLCLSPISRYQLSKKAKENSEAIVDLVGEACGFNLPLSHIPASPKEVAAPVKGFEDFYSRKDVLERIMKALQSQGSSIIGVHGMPGMGKTMLAKEVKRKAEQAELFDEVVMVLVTRDADLKKIQFEIARGLGLDLLPHGITLQDAAKCIKRKLKEMKKVFIILDDIWEPRIDLEELGIPLRNEPKTIEGSSSREEYAECKILLTSRDSNVLSDLMDSQQNFPVHQLKYEEAWELLKSIVGDRAERDDIQSAAIEIVRKCEGLPLAITTMAKALKNKQPYEWKDAVRMLKWPSSENFEGISKNVYSAIEFSYFHLESEKLKKTFLLCCLMGHGAFIQDLLKYGVGLGLFANAIEEARNEVLTLISKLRASSLLIDDYDNDYFDMHDLIHDVAVSIASRDRHGLLLTGDHVPKEWSDMEAMKDCRWIRMRRANVDLLPEGLECPHLSYFHLSNKDPSLQIPANFFKGMPRLKVLDLTRMHMSSLPSSICLLQNLHTLCLDQSVLGDIRIIGELKNLEILSLLHSDFEELPAEIGQLTRLKLLDLSDCTKLKIIPPRVLASMSILEELYLRNGFQGWEVGENENQRYVSLAELKRLMKLTTLEVCIPDIQMIPKDLFFKNLKRFKIFIGDKWDNRDSSFGSSRILKLHLNASIRFNHLVKMLLKMTEELHLMELAEVKNVVDELNTEGFPDLKYLYVRNAPEVQHIINSAEVVLFNAFPRLEVLFLQNLINLEKIFQGRFKDTAFNNLRIITIEYCEKVKNLFSSSIARQLLHLQEISVTDCGNMEEIVDDEEQGSRNDIVEATELKFGEVLRSLRLQRLPKLSSLNKSCRQMPLFNEQLVARGRIWNLTKLIIEGCDQLENLFFESIGDCLEKLEHLEIRDCKKMREIIVGEAGEGVSMFTFPSLKQLAIENCPELKVFVEYDQADKSIVRNALFHDNFVCPDLKIMTISHLKNLKTIWKNPDKDSFCNLRSLRVTYCQNLSTIFPCNSGMLEKLSGSLKELEIIGCSSVKQVFELGQSDITGQAEQPEEHKLIFQQLKFITIADCPNMVTFASTFSRDQEQGTFKPFFSTKVEFPKLELLVMEDCHGFKYLMTLSTVQSFSQLKELVIHGCKTMEEIIVTEKLTEENRISLFPKLNSMELEDLPELTRFCSEPQNLQATALFVFPKVTNLKFSKLPKLASFLTRNATEWPELTSIHVRECDRVQIFALEFPSGDNQIESRTQQHPLFWVNKGLEGQEGSSRVSTIDMNQQELEGQEGSSRSSTIDMPAVSFMNLRTLDLSRCHGLVTMLRYTMAKRLDQLSTMSITDCSKLEEIVACEGNEVKDEIVFTQLTSLRLGLLSRLESFCSGKCSFSFPSLHEVILSNCTEMSTFSKGVVKTQKLQKVKLTEEDDAGIWKDGDLNSSIQYLFTNKNHPAAEPFQTRTLPHLDEFHGRNAQVGNAINEDKETENGQEKGQNEADGLDHNENKGENSVSLDDSHPSVAQDAQESASKRNEVALSSKEKKRDEDAQEPDCKKS